MIERLVNWQLCCCISYQKEAFHTYVILCILLQFRISNFEKYCIYIALVSKCVIHNFTADFHGGFIDYRPSYTLGYKLARWWGDALWVVVLLFTCQNGLKNRVHFPVFHRRRLISLPTNFLLCLKHTSLEESPTFTYVTGKLIIHFLFLSFYSQWILAHLKLRAFWNFVIDLQILNCRFLPAF